MFKPFEESLDQFIRDRNWDKYHNISSTAMAFSCEVAELLEYFSVYEYRKEMKEVEKEIGDCFITLFCVYRILNFDIHDHLSKSKALEEEAFSTLKKTHKKADSPDFLVKYLSVRAGFLQEAFLWIDEKENKNYTNTLPNKTLVEPFNILLSLCHVLNFRAEEVMSKKLLLAAEKYTLNLTADENILLKMNEAKKQKRGQ